jgi:5-methylcytosine-specific restriction endonuclease McrA
MHGRGEYPPNWDEIAQEVKERAEWVCEHCGHPHDSEHGYCLTVHHLDGDKSNCTYENLVALCQKCHLRIQATYRPGQMCLFPYQRPLWMKERNLGT